MLTNALIYLAMIGSTLRVLYSTWMATWFSVGKYAGTDLVEV